MGFIECVVTTTRVDCSTNATRDTGWESFTLFVTSEASSDSSFRNLLFGKNGKRLNDVEFPRWLE